MKENRERDKVSFLLHFATLLGGLMFQFSSFIIIQEFVEARRTAGLNNTPPCSWSLTPPLELKEVPADALSANAGFVTFGQCQEKCHIVCIHIFFASITAMQYVKLCSYLPSSCRRPETGSYSMESVKYCKALVFITVQNWTLAEFRSILAP